MHTAAGEPGSTRRMLDFRSGGWVLLLAAALCVLTAALWVHRLTVRRPLIGDGRNVASYRFDLTTCRVPRAEIVAAGFGRDGVPAMVSPEIFTAAQTDSFSDELRRSHQGRYLVSADRVIGVFVGGAARAYPLRVITWHEVVDDTLGDQPIVVTYNPLCDSAAVFDRRVAGETLDFGVSGLLYNSNLLLYDRRPGATGESLWSQLQFRAIAGPAAERDEALTLVLAVVVHWSDWRARYPDTTVLAPDPERMAVYQNTYDPYFGSETLRFPVDPIPPADGPPLKTRVLAVRVGGDWHVFALADIARQADPAGFWETELDGRSVRFLARTEPSAVWPEAAADEPLQSISSFWFAWYAMHPNTALSR